MNLNEAKQLLEKNGYLLEFRDASQPKDKEIEDDNYMNGKRSWNNAVGRGGYYDKEMKYVAKVVNNLIEKVDEVANRFEDYDYFVKRYDYEKIQIRTTDNGVVGGPFLQISCYYNEDNKSCKFECVVGAVPFEVNKKYRLSCDNEEKVLQWVSNCLGKGVINSEY